MAQLVKNPPAMWETWVQSLGWEDPLEKGKTPHSSILDWRILWSVHEVTKSWTRLSTFPFTEVVILRTEALRLFLPLPEVNRGSQDTDYQDTSAPVLVRHDPSLMTEDGFSLTLNTL